MRLLFITSNRLGDAVLSTSVLRHYVETYPGIKVTIACGPVAAPIFQAVPNIERIIEIPKQKRGGHWWKLWKSVVLNWWDVIVDLRGSATSYVLPGWKRVVLKGNDDGLHRVEQMARLIGIKTPLFPKIWLSPGNRKRAKELLPTERRQPVLAFGPTANWGGKMWPIELFEQLIAQLTCADGLFPDAHLLVLGAPGEQDMAAPLINSIPENRRTVIFGSETLLTVQGCLENVDAYIGNDSGLMHMAAASGSFTLGLFGPSRPENYAPYGPDTAYVCTDSSYDDIVAAGVDWKSQKCLMTDLSVEKVVAAVRRRFGQKS